MLTHEPQGHRICNFKNRVTRDLNGPVRKEHGDKKQQDAVRTPKVDCVAFIAIQQEDRTG